MPTTTKIQAHLEHEGRTWPHGQVLAAKGREALGELYECEVFVEIDGAHELGDETELGADIALVIVADSGPGRAVSSRTVHGVIGALRERHDERAQRRHLWITIAPRISQLARVETQDVYLDLSVAGVVRQKLTLHGFEEQKDFELRLSREPAPRELVVQYGESDLAFVMRLCEHLGFTLFFEHGESQERLVVTDHGPGLHRARLEEPLSYRSGGEALGVFDAQVERRPIPSGYYVQDYNYRTPMLLPLGDHELAGEAAGGIVEFGSHVKTPDEAAQLARVRAEERASRKTTFSASTTNLEPAAGMTIRIDGCPLLGDIDELLVVRVAFEVDLRADATSDSAGYRARFDAIDAKTPFRPARVTPRPRMPGVVTGVVQPGPGGARGGVARLTDDGRYVVQLHFDTADREGVRASHPIRMAQPFGGHGNGMHFPLVPGTEVLVAFTNGDPDRPIIVGALPNPLSPASVVAADGEQNRIRTKDGITIEFGATPARRSS
jgi:type VI secretion system secreted protein VgrG